MINEPSQIKKYDILKIRFDLIAYNVAMETIEQWRRNHERHYVTITNPYSVMMCSRDTEMRKATEMAGITLPDGIGVVLAAADDRLIDAFVASTRGRLTKDMVIKFPTRVDTSLFRPIPKCVARKALNIDEEIPLIVNCGRINNVKGWKFLCDAFRIFLRSHNNAQMVFVGDGEDRQRLQKYIYDYDLTPYIKITGFKPTNQVAEFLNAASIVVVGSYYEGWSLAMLEALACGKSIVSTDVSGAKDMILEDGNGYIIEKRDPKCFAEAMNRGLALTETEKISLRLVKKYALKNLARDLGTLWKPLQQAERGSIE